MTDDTTDRDQKGWRKARWLLMGSLALNLLIIGAVIGAVVSGGARDRGPRDRVDRVILRDIAETPLARALSKDDRSAMMDALRADPDGLHASRQRLKRGVDALLDVVRADPFDADTARRILSTQRSALSERGQLGDTLLVDQWSRMSAGDRAAYADRLEGFFRRGARRRESR